MGDIMSVLFFLFMLYLLYRLAVFLYTIAKVSLLWIWMILGLTPAARFRRIVRRTQAEQDAISQVYVSEMKRISDSASNSIIDRR